MKREAPIKEFTFGQCAPTPLKKESSEKLL